MKIVVEKASAADYQIASQIVQRHADYALVRQPIVGIEYWSPEEEVAEYGKISAWITEGPP